MTVTTITVYDPPMCCSTGVCGPEVDPNLAQFASDLEWLKAQGVKDPPLQYGAAAGPLRRERRRQGHP